MDLPRLSLLVAILLLLAALATWVVVQRTTSSAVDTPIWETGRTFGPPVQVRQPHSPLLNKDGNVHLYVCSDVFVPDIVDICVSIDGNVIVRNTFAHDLDNKVTHYCVRLSTGTHKLTVVSERGQARFEDVFNVDDQLHMTISYTYYEPSLVTPETPPFFGVHIDKEPYPAWQVQEPH
jgi:hypothetical protein